MRLGKLAADSIRPAARAGRAERRNIRVFSQIAIRMIAPVTIWVKNGEMCIRIRPLPMAAIVSAPSRVPTMVPRPPISEVPPSTTAAMTSSSKPTAALEEPEPSRAAIMMPAIAEAMPVRP